MRTIARIFGFIPAGTSRRVALALLGVAALSAGLSGCGAGTEALPSDLPPPTVGGALIITTTSMEDGVINRSYSKTLDTTGGTPPLTACSFSGGTPPPGLGVAPSGSTCVVSGIPTMAGTFSFTVLAGDSASRTDTQDYIVVIRDEFTITGPAPDPLPDGVEDRAYNFVFTVTTDTVIGPDDFGEAAENGNGPLTQCGVTGLPAGMNAVGASFTANSCQITVSGTPNIGLGPMSAPVTFLLTLTVRDTAIGGSNVPRGTVTQTNIDLTIQPPVAITLITTDVASTAGCTGGTFDDSTGGGNAPVAVNGRTYGNPRCDLLFGVTGGIAPYAWSDNSASPLTPQVCTQEGANNEFFRCNSMGAGVTTAAFTSGIVIVEVMDAGNAATAISTQGTDIFGHASHSIFVNDSLAVVSDLGDPLPDAVMGQPYGEAPGNPATFTATGGTCDPTVNGSCSFSTAASIGAPGAAFPTTIACATGTSPNANRFACATSASTITANTGTYTPAVNVTDVANDTTPAGAPAMVTVNLDVVAAMMFTLITADAGTTMACTGGGFDDTNFAGTSDFIRGVIVRPYGGPGRCDLLFQVTGGRPPYTWVTTSAAPAPIACAQETDVNANDTFRCNSGGANVSGSTASLGVQVSDTGNATLAGLTTNTDAQGHTGHTIGVQNQLATLVTPQGATPSDAPDGVTGREYGTPTGGQDLVFSVPVVSGLRPVQMDPDEATSLGSSSAAGFPADLECTQSVDAQTECTTGASTITDPAGTYLLTVSATDTQNDTTPSANTMNFFTLEINDEIVINNMFLTNGVVGSSYTQTLTCDPGTGFCGGTGAPDNAAAMYTWGETNTIGLCPPDAPANPDITVSTSVATNPSTGQYSGTATTANAGFFTVNICAVDDGNATTPDCNTAGTCPIFIFTYNIFDAVAAIDASNNEVDLFDTNTNTFNAGAFGLGANVTLDAGSTPFRAAFTPNGSFLVVVDPAEGEVDIINVATGAITNVATAGAPSSVAIGPESDPLTDPDAWMAYVANPTAGTVQFIGVNPNNPGFGVVNSVAIAGAKDVASTPTFAGPQTRVYVLSGTDDVCVIDAQPGSPTFLMQIDLTATIGTPCIDTSAIPGDTMFIEITPNGLQALVTKQDGGGEPAGMAQLVRIDTDPTSGTRDTVTTNVDLGPFGCFLPNDLRSHSSGFVLVACGTDTTTGDTFLAFEVLALGFLGPFPVTAGDDPQDVAFTITGVEAIGSLKGVSSIRTIFAGVTTALPNVTAPDGVDHIRDPQLNSLININFPGANLDLARAGREFTTSVAATGGVQPYSWSVVETSGTACEGLSLNPITGRISGTPVNTGTCSLTVQVTDSTPGAPQSRRVTKTITVE